MKKPYSRQYGFLLGAVILLFIILAHEFFEFKKYKLTLMDNFKAEQKLLTQTFITNYSYLMNDVSGRLKQLDKHFRQYGFEHTLEQFEFLTDHNKDELAFTALYGPDHRLIKSNPEPTENRMGFVNLKTLLDTTEIPTGGYLTRRLFTPEGEVLVALILPSRLPTGSYYFVSGIRIGQYTRSFFDRWGDTHHSFFLINGSGEILSFYNINCDSTKHVVTGNIYNLGPACQPCHVPNEFDYFRSVSDSIENRLHVFSNGKSDLRSLVSLPFVNDRWVLCVEGPYDDIVALAKRNARSILFDSGLLLIIFASIVILFLRSHRRQVFLEAEAREYKKFHDIIDHMEEGYFETDIRGTFTFVNEAMERIFGYSRDELLGMNNRDFMSEEAAAHIYQDVHSVFRSGQAQKNVRWEIRTKAGEARIAESSISPRVDAGGNIIGFRGVLRDETDRIRATEALERSEKKHRRLSQQLARTIATKDLLLDIISHDIKNPASAILGFSDLLLEEHPQIEELKYIRDASSQLINMVKNANTLIHLETTDEMPREKVPIGERVYWLAKEFAMVNKHLQIENRIPEDFVIHANPIIEEVLRNYISNAVKYAAQGKQIRIAVERLPGAVIFSVADRGTTLKKEMRDKIFRRNFQINKGRGQGLGLAIVSKIAQAHGGQAWVEPNKPTGNIFYLKIPQPDS